MPANSRWDLIQAFKGQKSEVVMSPPPTKIGGWEVCPITCPPISQYSTFHVLSLLGKGMTKIIV